MNKTHEQNNDISLETRMKIYETETLQLSHIPFDKPYIVRLDGRRFSKYTKQFKCPNGLPYSPEFKQAMIYTAYDLLKEFNAQTAYTHSDEITLIFKQQCINSRGELNEHMFNGRVVKILTLISSYASVVFNKHINKLYPDCNPDKNAIFDARVIVFTNNYEISNHMIWRSRFDCVRNFISLYAETYIGKKNIYKLSVKDRLDSLSKIGCYICDTDENFYVDYSMKHGIFIKKHNFYIFRNLKFSDTLYNFLINADIYDYDDFYDIKYNISELIPYSKKTCTLFNV